MGNAPSLLNKVYTITAEVTIPKGGAEGMIATMGGVFGGYGLYLLKGKPVFVYNLLNLKRTRWEGGVGSADLMGKALEPGKHTIAFEFTYDGPGPGRVAPACSRWTVRSCLGRRWSTRSRLLWPSMRPLTSAAIPAHRWTIATSCPSTSPAKSTGSPTSSGLEEDHAAKTEALASVHS